MAVRVETVPVGMLQVNCHLVWDPASRCGVVLDPGDDAEEIGAAVARAGFAPAAVLLTHGHVDHIGAVGALCARYGLPAYLHPDDRALYLSPANAIPPWLPAATNLPTPVHALPTLDGLDLRVLATPGHTAGSVCFYAPAAGVLFSGDTLFCGGVGRTDLPGGSQRDLERSVRDVLYALPRQTRVYPGHGGPTEIGSEMDGNPFIRP